MAATALIQLTQGGNVGTAGQALFGATGTSVVISNNSNTNVLSWQIDLVYVPPGSALSTGTLASNDNSATPSASFTPDVRGPYRIVLKVWNAINRVGIATDTDIRNFGIKEANGIYRPAPQLWPRPLPPTSSGEAGNKPDENNFAGQGNGWSGSGSDGLLDNALSRIDAAIQIGAGTQTGTSGSIVFLNSNGMSFGMSGSTRITASYTVPTVTSATISAGTTSGTLSNLVFSNSNGLSFGLNAGTITGSYTVPNVPAQTVQTQNIVVPAGSNTTYTSGTVVFTGSNAVTVRSTTGQAIVIDVPIQTAQTQSNVQGISAGTQVGRTGDIVFSNSNGLSFGMAGSNTITASYTVPSTAGLISNINLSAGTTSQNLSAAVFSNSNNISFGLNGSTITASASYSQSTAPAAISAGTTQATNGTIVFSNSNGISFGMNNGTITATVNPGAAAGIAAIQGGTQTATSGTVIFSNSNGISFGLSGSSQMTASYTVPSTAGLISAINASAGTTSNNLSAIVFSNSNNVSFGLNGSTVTATISVPVQTNQTVGLFGLGNTTQNSSTTLDARSLSLNGLGAATVGYSNGSIQISVPVQTVQTQSNIAGIYDGANSISTGTIRFSNSNGVTFGINGQTITASHNGITAGIQSFSAGTTRATAGELVFSNSNGISFGLNGNTVTATVNPGAAAGIAAIQGGTQTATSGTVIFSDSNGISFGLSGSTRMTASVATSLTNVNLSAGTTSNNLSAFVFSNSNGVSFGLNGSTVTGSIATSLTNINVSAGTTSNNLSVIVFSNSNNFSFGMNGSTVTGSYTVPTQTNQTVGMYALGNTTQNSSTTFDARTISLNGLGAVTVGYSNGSVQISAPVQTAQTQSNIAGIYDGANSISTGTIRFTNANGVSFSINGQTISGSVAAQSVQTVGMYALGNTTQNSSSTFDARTLSFNGLGGNTVGYSNGSIQISGVTTAGLISAVNFSAGTTSTNATAIVFSNSNNFTFGLNGATVTASFNGANAGIGAVSAGTQSKTSGTLIFSNSNNISFGMSGSNTITASYSQSNQTVGFYAVGNTTQNSSTTLDARTVSYNAIGGVTMGYSNGSIQVSGPGISSLSATGAVSISVNADTISIGVPVRNVSHLMWPEVPWGTNFSISNASFSLQHFNPKADITATQANLLMALSGNTNSSGALTVSMGIYTMSGSTMSLASSDSRALTWTSGSQTSASSLYGGISGTRYRTVPLASWSISAGDYMLGMWFRTTNDGTWRAFGIQGPTIVGAVDANETNQYLNGFSTSSFTTAMIASINVTATNFVRTGGNALQQPSMIFLGSF